jgi:hypothetical protein
MNFIVRLAGIIVAIREVGEEAPYEREVPEVGSVPCVLVCQKGKPG